MWGCHLFARGADRPLGATSRSGYVCAGCACAGLNCGNGAVCNARSERTRRASVEGLRRATGPTCGWPASSARASVVLNPATAAALKRAEITVTAVALAKATTVLVFPVTGGHVVVASPAGTIEPGGGLTFSHAGKSVTLTRLAGPVKVENAPAQTC